MLRPAHGLVEVCHSGQHQPDAVSCSTTISSCDRGSQWQEAIRVFNCMILTQSHHPIKEMISLKALYKGDTRDIVSRRSMQSQLESDFF